MAHIGNWMPDLSKEEREFFDKCPKSVLFEIARQFGMRVADDFTAEGGFGAVMSEWTILYQNQLLPQRPPKKFWREDI